MGEYMSFLAAQYGTVSDIELVWTIIALVGIIFSGFNVYNAILDRKALAKLPVRNGRWLLASFALRAELARMAILLIFFSIGIGAMLLQDPPSQLTLPTVQVVVGTIFRWGLVISALLITLKSYWAYELRNTLMSADDIRNDQSDTRAHMKSQFGDLGHPEETSHKSEATDPDDPTILDSQRLKIHEEPGTSG